MLVSRDIGISGGCVGPHDVTPDLPAPARLSPHRRVLGNARACVEVPHHEEGEGEDGRGRLIPSYYNGTACQAACCFSIKETDADVGESASVAARVAVAAACISIEGRSGGPMMSRRSLMEKEPTLIPMTLLTALTNIFSVELSWVPVSSWSL